MTDKDLEQRAYSPYSEMEPEWCVVIGSSGIAYPGVRIENISFPLTITSVHGAICSCLGNGDRPVAYVKSSEYLEMESYWVETYSLDKLDSVPASADIYDPVLPLHTDPDMKLEELTHHSITPHSDFPVAALLQTDSGYVPGVNVELDSWTLGLCAERVALFRAVSHGFTEFTNLLISAPKGDFSSPCGACRQVLMEWMPRGSVTLNHGDGSKSSHNTSHLLPHAFSSSKLTP